MGQVQTSNTFYWHGRKNSTKTGYWDHVNSYYPSKPQSDAVVPSDAPAAGDVDLTGKCIGITGGNSGIGLTLARFAASKGAEVFLLCRSKERGEAAAEEIRRETKNDKVTCFHCDVSSPSSIDEMTGSLAAVDALVCNAGCLLNERQETPEGIEQTVATHLIYGSYYLTKKLQPYLSDDARIIYVSSGGMYNFKFPSWPDFLSNKKENYSGNSAYAYAKRGQVILAEHLQKTLKPNQRVVSCHPGWTDTPGVEAAYGRSKMVLNPMRTPWEGAEGISWLLYAPSSEIEGGAFYLDRKPQEKHLVTRTQNSVAEECDMMKNLKDMTDI